MGTMGFIIGVCKVFVPNALAWIVLAGWLVGAPREEAIQQNYWQTQEVELAETYMREGGYTPREAASHVATIEACMSTWEKR